MTGCISQTMPSNPSTHPMLKAQVSAKAVHTYAYLGKKYYKGKHPTDGIKYKALCFSILDREFVDENPKELKKIIKDRRLAYVTFKDSQIVKLEIHKKWYASIVKNRVTETVQIQSDTEGRISLNLLMNKVDRAELSANLYRELENIQSQYI